MLSDAEREQLFVSLGLSEAARTLVRGVVANSPVREVSSRLGNVLVDQYSHKMARHLALESNKTESPAATLYEYDDDVLEYYPQACRVDLVLRDSDGTATGRASHVADFLVIRRTKITLEEWRNFARLRHLAESAGQFSLDANDQWHYRAAEDHFNAIGLQHHTRCDTELPRRLVDNSIFLADYRLPTCPALSVADKQRIHDVFDSQLAISLRELISKYAFTADVIFRAVAEHVVFADLLHVSLSETDLAVLYRDESAHRVHLRLTQEPEPVMPFPGMSRTVRIGTPIEYRGTTFVVLLVSGTQVLLKSADGDTLELDIADIVFLTKQNKQILTIHSTDEARRPASMADLAYVDLNRTLQKLEAIETGSGAASKRSIGRWRRKAHSACDLVGKIVALADNDACKGNRLRRIPEVVELLANTVITDFYNTPTCPTGESTYLKFVEECGKQQLTPTGRTAFYRRIQEKKSTTKRQGKRQAYQKEPIPLFLDYKSPVHGVRPHDVCYIDHTPVNMKLRGSRGQKRPTPILTLARDGNTTQSRAMYLSYDPASTTAVFMALRDYVRRNGRLPRVLVVDGGREFRSVALKKFCKAAGIDLRHRTPGEPRAGSPIERLFGMVETELIAQLEGNTRNEKNIRTVTKSIDPQRFRTWSFEALWKRLDQYLFAERNNVPHPTFGMTPKEYEVHRFGETGIREHTLVYYDDNLVLMTAPPPKTKPMRLIDAQRGVFADYGYYWHPEFATAKLHQKYEVRVEPWHSKIVYVHINGHWVAAIARDISDMTHRTRREYHVAERAQRTINQKLTRDERRSLSRAQRMGKLRELPMNEDVHDQQLEMYAASKKFGLVRLPEGIEAALPEVVTAANDAATGGDGAEVSGAAVPVRNPGTVESETGDEERNDRHDDLFKKVWGFR